MDMNVVIAGKGPDVLLIHGYPDTHAVWRHQIPVLVSAGYRVIAPDTRGCGESEISLEVSAYKINNLVLDIIGLLDALSIQKVRLIAHDFGAAIAWHVVINHPERIDRYIALSVGHLTAYAKGGVLQKLKGYYILLLQLRGLAEFFVTQNDWLLLYAITRYKEELPQWRTELSRPGRLTAGMNYYRANLGLILPSKYPPVEVPVFGIWSSGDLFLTEKQMLDSQQYVNASWRYARI